MRVGLCALPSYDAAMVPTPMLEARHLVKTYGRDFRAVDDISFTIGRGQVFCLLGSNGAGKTTTLKIFGGLLQPTSGTALVKGIDVQQDPMAVKRLLGYLPEAPALYETITGEEFLRLLGTLRQMEPERLEERIARLGKVLELAEQLQDQIGTYSKGMRQKLAFASAVLHEPPVLILDEPTSGLDPRYGRLFKDWLRHLGAKGTTILLSTHITAIAEDVADTIAIVVGGTLRAQGAPTALQRQYGTSSIEDTFVAVVGGERWELS